jgi:prepilin-type N-terminal cleavage/methylation domain-containing protein
MLKKLNKKNKLPQGFTIIEVMIVLAIAGLMLVVVLIAIPQLQRNQRNSARKATLARITSEISNYSGNNNGQIPDDATSLTSFQTRYLDSINIEDPSTGTAILLILNNSILVDGAVPNLSSEVAKIDDDGAVSDAGGDLGVAYYSTAMECDGEAVAAVSGGSRNFAVVTVLEGGAIYCLDNK